MRILIDEMFPAAAAAALRGRGHDAVHVSQVGLSSAADELVAHVARAEDRAVVTENIAGFAAEEDVVLVCVLKRALPRGGGQARALADVVDGWAQANPVPYRGQHWPAGSG